MIMVHAELIIITFLGALGVADLLGNWLADRRNAQTD